jgi:hypothetical protein
MTIEKTITTSTIVGQAILMYQTCRGLSGREFRSTRDRGIHSTRFHHGLSRSCT